MSRNNQKPPYRNPSLSVTLTEFFPENLRKILTAEQLEGGTATYSLVGFTGELGSGKDTAGEALTKIGHTRFAFGDALKRMLKHGLGLTQEQLHGTQAQKAEPIDWLDCEVTPRRMMQTLGTEWGRDLIHPDLWVLALRRELETHLIRRRLNAVVTDVRFENEASMIRELGGVIIHVRRPKPKKPWWQQLFSREHRSERPPKVRPGDFVVQNIGTVEDLHRAVLEVVQQPLLDQGANGG